MAEIQFAANTTISGAVVFADSVTMSSSVLNNGGDMIPQTQPASVTIPDGYSYIAQTRYKITGTNSLTVQGAGIFSVR